MTNPDLRIQGFEMVLSDDSHEPQWTETVSRSECSVLTSLVDDEDTRSPKMITVRVKDVIDALVGRSTARPVWLSDFHDDPISITEDMFEVLVAYRTMLRAA